MNVVPPRANDGRLLRVGILGAGPVTQAIHLPVLARLTGLFEVVLVMDVDPIVAESVAARIGADFVTTESDFFSDERLDVVAICSPHQFHAQQVIAACRADLKAVLCEKPFAMSEGEATAISAVSAATGVPIIVGAMHTFDPGWLEAEREWGDLVESAHTIRSRISLPPNARFEDFATEVINRPELSRRDAEDPDAIAAMIVGGVMGLAIHDLPLVRRFLPQFEDLQVLRANLVKPMGYSIVATASDRVVQLQAVMSATWQPEWTFEVVSPTQKLTVEFTPSYVHAGSAVAVLESGGSTRTFGPFDRNGYEGEWEYLAAVAHGRSTPPAAEHLIQDLRFALRIADRAGEVSRASRDLAE